MAQPMPYPGRVPGEAQRTRGGVLPAATIARRMGTASSRAKPTTKKIGTESVSITKDNLQKEIIDSGYYTQAEIDKGE